MDQRPTPRRLPLSVALRRTVAASVAAAVLLFGVLTVQMAIGHDPTLSSSAAADTPRSSATDGGLIGFLTSDDEGDDDESDDEGTVAPTPQPLPAPAPVQTSTS